MLEAYSSETEIAYQHTLLLAFTTKQGPDQCDLIEVVDWIYSVDKENGQITKGFKLLYQMETQLVHGVPEKCHG